MSFKEIITQTVNPKACGAGRWMIPSTDTYKFVGAKDNTIIYRNGVQALTINRNEVSDLSLTVGDIINTNEKLISFCKSGEGQTGLPYAWSGYIFAHRVDRYTIIAYITATEKDGIVNLYQGGVISQQINVTKDTLTTVTLPSGETTFYSNVPICILTGDLGTQDVLPLYPCEENIIYGCPSSGGHLIAVFNNTNFIEYATNDSIVSRPSLDAGQRHDFSTGGGNQFTGPSVALSSNKPGAAESQADADGGEMTPFVGKKSFGTLFAVPEDQRDFTKFYSNSPAVISAYNESGLISETTMTGSTNGEGIYHARLTGTESYEGVVYETSEPVTAIFESANDDETILMAFDETPTTTELVPITSVPYEIHTTPRVITDGLSFYVDSTNPKSYPGSGNQWVDLVNGGVMTLNGNYSFSDGILNFNGNSYAELPTNTNVQVAGTSFSLNVWFKILGTSSSGGFGRIFNIDGPNGAGFGNWTLAFDEDDRYVRFGYNTTNGNNEIYNSNFNDGEFFNKWYNYQSTFNAETGLFRLYRNGDLISQGVGRQSHYGLPTVNSVNCRIGTGDEITIHWLNAAIPVAALYKKELSENEVKQNYNSFKSKFIN